MIKREILTIALLLSGAVATASGVGSSLAQQEATTSGVCVSMPADSREMCSCLEANQVSEDDARLNFCRVSDPDEQRQVSIQQPDENLGPVPGTPPGVPGTPPGGAPGQNVRGNNGVGNGVDPAPPGIGNSGNDAAGQSPGNPGGSSTSPGGGNSNANNGNNSGGKKG